MRNSLNFEQGKALQKAEIMLQVEDRALWTSISGSRLKKSPPPEKTPFQGILFQSYDENKPRKRRHYTELLLRRTILKAKPDASQRSTSESLSLVFIVGQNNPWPDDSLVPKGNLSHSALVEWECSAGLHTEWKHKQSAFTQKNPLLHGGWGGKGEKAAGRSFVEPKWTNRANKPHCFISSYSSDNLLLPSTPSNQHWYCLEQNKVCGQGSNNKTDSPQDK